MNRPPKKEDEIALPPDGWARFETAVDVATHRPAPPVKKIARAKSPRKVRKRAAS